MVAMEALFRTLDLLTPEEKQQVVAYIERYDTGADQPTETKARTPRLFPATWMSADFNDELPDSVRPQRQHKHDEE